MAWSQVGSIRGPQGDRGIPGQEGAPGANGVPGRGVASTQLNANGELLVTFTDGATSNVGVVRGANGADGTSVQFAGSVLTEADLPEGPLEPGTGYIVQDTGHLFVHNGTEFVDVGNITGPKGDKGDPGVDGQPGADGPRGLPGQRGSRWYVGNGAPVDGAYPEAVAGLDHYLDIDSGVVYDFA